MSEPGGSESHCLVASARHEGAHTGAASSAAASTSAPSAGGSVPRSSSDLLQVELRSVDRRRRSQQSVGGGSVGGGGSLQLAVPTAGAQAQQQQRGSFSQHSARSARSSIASDPGILMMDVHQPAHALDPKYLYHAFVCYHASDRQWALGLIKRLEAEPYCYRLCYDMRDFNRTFSHIQNVVCSVMLSQRVILVLSGQFVSHSWPELEDALQHACPPAGQRKRKIVPVTLGDALELPDLIKPLTVLSANHRNFFDRLLLTLKHENIVLSESSTTLWSVMSHSAGSENGHLLVLARGRIARQWSVRPEFAHSLDHTRHQPSVELIDSFFSAADLNAMMSGIFSDGQQLNWRLSHCPSLAFLALLVLWILAILAVLLLLREPAKYILFVRLAVFILPAVLLLVGYFIRWRSFNFHKEELSRRIFMNTVRTNAQLYASRRPFIVSTFHFKKDDSYQVFLMYYNPEECIEYIRQILLRVRPVEHRKLASLLAVYTLDSDYLRGHRLEERIAVMMCGAYGLELATKKLPAPIEQRHTRKRQCLCQFVEEFLAAYLPMLQHSESFTVQHIRTVFLRYLNCTIFPDQVVVETLGLVCPSDLEAEELATEGQRRRPGTSRNVKAEDPAVIVPMSQEQEETV